jgi:hypothetical protein
VLEERRVTGPPPNPMAAIRASHPDRELLEFYDKLIDREMALMAGMPLHGRPWQNVAALLAARVLQLQRACLDMATLGYSRELTATSRAMLSSLLALIFLVHGRSHAVRDAKAVRYLVHERSSRRKLLKYLVRSRWLKAADARKQDSEATAGEDGFLADAERAGIKPLRVGPHERYWTGYDDKTLFEKMNAGRWYYHYYSPWSDDSHGGASALVEFAVDLEKTGALNIGPHARSPWFDLLATAMFGVELAKQVRRVYRIGGKAEIEQLWREASDTFSRLKR